MRVPSTGVASTHRRPSMPMERSWNSTNEYPRPTTWAVAETSKVRFAIPTTLWVRLKSKLLRRCAPSNVTAPTRPTLP